MQIYLVVVIIFLIIGCVLGFYMGVKFLNPVVESYKRMSNKHLELFKLTMIWIDKVQHGKNVYSYFRGNNIHSIAVYGMSYLGKALVNELAGTEVEVRYGIESNPTDGDGMLLVCSLEDELEEVDMIVVTPITYFNDINEKLKTKVKCQVVSIYDVITSI